MTRPYTSELTTALKIAKEEASKNQCVEIYSAHVLYGMLSVKDCETYHILQTNNINPEEVKTKAAMKLASFWANSNGKSPVDSQHILNTLKILNEKNDPYPITTDEYLKVLIKDECDAQRILKEFGIIVENNNLVCKTRKNEESTMNIDKKTAPPVTASKIKETLTMIDLNNYHWTGDLKTAWKKSEEFVKEHNGKHVDTICLLYNLLKAPYCDLCADIKYTKCNFDKLINDCREVAIKSIDLQLSNISQAFRILANIKPKNGDVTSREVLHAFLNDPNTEAGAFLKEQGFSLENVLLKYKDPNQPKSSSEIDNLKKELAEIKTANEKAIRELETRRKEDEETKKQINQFVKLNNELKKINNELAIQSGADFKHYAEQVNRILEDKNSLEIALQGQKNAYQFLFEVKESLLTNEKMYRKEINRLREQEDEDERLIQSLRDELEQAYEVSHRQERHREESLSRGVEPSGAGIVAAC